ERGLHGAEGAFGFQQVLVTERDVLGGQVGIGRGQQVLAVEAGLGGDLGGIDGQPPGTGVLLEPAAQRGVVAQRALGLTVGRVRRRCGAFAGLGGLGLRLLRVRFPGRLDARQLLTDGVELIFPSGGIALGFGGVVADDPASVAVTVEAVAVKSNETNMRL
ncbi:hypothetical protein JL475_39365, partial [Streptomyces sp. M2CJ-2]|uniref:hypothetical protein n=1 Tax=Streptomyces sp. M2CJ-2 TaxID=2803948 RepID=UPI001925879B